MAFVEGAQSGGCRVMEGSAAYDDAAVFGRIEVAAGEQIVSSVDQAVEDVHFKRDWGSWTVVGRRAVAGALADLAAMNASAEAVLVAVAAPRDLGVEEFRQLGHGVGQAAFQAGARLAGGDISMSPAGTVIGVTVFGTTPRPLLRSGARPGDELWVTGYLGGAAAAVAALKSGEQPKVLNRFSLDLPPVRIEEVRWLADRVNLTAGIDISDGLLRDASQIAAASGCRLIINLDCVPASPSLDGTASMLALTGGEDHEILLAAPSGAIEAAEPYFSTEFWIPLTRIGGVEEGRGVGLRGTEEFGDDELREIARLAAAPETGGFVHFS